MTCQMTCKVKQHICSPPVISLGVAIILTWALYGDTLTLPLFSDDLVQIPWLEHISWHALWTSPSPYGYYRPLWYTLWRIWGGVTGGLRPFGLHALNLIAQVMAAWMVGLLAVAWSVWEDSSHRMAVAALSTAWFATFPFARQAVAWPGAVYNPLVSAMAAGALLAYDRGRRENAPLWFLCALILVGIAPLTYEVGLLVPLLLALAEAIGQLSHRWSRRGWWWSLLFIAALPVTFLLWQRMRGAGVTGFGLTAADVRHNLGYLLQGAVYPTAPLAQWLVERLSYPPEAGLWLVALSTGGLLVAGLRRAHRPLLALGVVWSLLFAIPPIVSMKSEWFALAPRYLYMTAGGSALVWAIAIVDWIWRGLERLRLTGRRSALGLWGLCGGVLLLLLLPAGRFIRQGVHWYTLAGESIWDAAHIAEEADDPILLVNLPMRITPRRRLYPLGFEGITPLPMRVTAEDLAYVYTGRRISARAVSFGIVATDDPPDYTYLLHGPEIGWEDLAAAVRQGVTIYLTRYESARIHLVEAGSMLSANTLSISPLALFGGRIALLNATSTCDLQGRIRLVTDWRVESSIETDATVFVHLLDTEGTVIAQADGYPLRQMLPFWLLRPGETVHDVRDLGPVSPGAYTLRLGIWDLATGEQWPSDHLSDGFLLQSVHCLEGKP